MKVGIRMPAVEINHVYRRGEYVWESNLRRAAAIGYDGIEMTNSYPLEMLTGYPLTELLTESEFVKMKEDAKKHGVEIPSYSIDWAAWYCAWHRKLSEWQRCGNGIRFMKDEIKMASDLGAKVILIHFAGAKGTLNEVKEILFELVQEAEKHKIKLGYESNLWRGLQLGDLGVLKNIVEEIGSQYFGIYVHYNDEYLLRMRGIDRQPTMTPEEEIEFVGKDLVGIHSSGIFPESEVNYKALLATIKKYYDYYWIFEVRSTEAIETSKKAFDELVAK